jgi:hypothetical protein
MSAIFLVVGVFLQATLTWWVSTHYFRKLNRTRPRNGILYRILEYLLFLPFVLLVVPVSIFFPAWLSELLGVFQPTAKATSILLFVGMLALVVSVAFGRLTARRSS